MIQLNGWTVKSMLKEFDVGVGVTTKSGAKGRCLGRVTHADFSQLGIQEKVSEGILKVIKVTPLY